MLLTQPTYQRPVPAISVLFLPRYQRVNIVGFFQMLQVSIQSFHLLFIVLLECCWSVVGLLPECLSVVGVLSDCCNSV